jgi:Ca-activated chloride channel family protein
VRPNTNLSASERIDTPLSVSDLEVDVRIRDRRAHVQVDQVIVNGSPAPVTSTNLWPAPSGIKVSGFYYTVNGERVPGEQVSGEAADAVYRQAAATADDPRILAYLGRPFFRGPATSIAAGGRARMRMEFDADLPEAQGIARFHHPFDTNTFSRLPINHARIHVALETTEPLSFYYSPTQAFTWTRSGANAVEGSYTESGTKPDRDLLLYYGTGRGEVDLRVLADRQSGFAGTFLAAIHPGADMPTSAYVPRDLVFVLDRSGSMSGAKIQQARSGLEFSLSRLNPEDRFSIVTFDNQVTPWRSELLPATPENVAAAQQEVRRISPGGGTNIHDALKRGLQILGRGERPAAVIFLTDGLPTSGVTDLGQIRTAIQGANPRKARVFVFGVGYDVNVPFLDRLSAENRGDAEYVRPGDNLETRMASFYQKQAQPLLTDLKLVVDGVGTSDVIPAELPDLFANGEVIVVGRYRTPGTVTLHLSGKLGDAERTYTKSFELPAAPTPYSFLPRLWAQRKIGDLLDEVRLHGAKPELIQQITSLSREFAILTDYTRGYVDTAVSLKAPAQAAALAKSVDRANTFQQGAFATSQSVNNRAMRQQAQVYGNAYLDESGRQVQNGGARQAGSRSQFLRGGYWTDPDWSEEAQPLRIKRFSAAYWEISKRLPETNSALAAGPRLRLLIHGKPVEIGDDGATELTPADRAALFVKAQSQGRPSRRSAVPFLGCVALAALVAAVTARRRSA